MPNKNLNQLPTNDAPQETDWLLGASGQSPAVFQKIPVGSIQPTGGSSGGSIKFSLPVNQNTALTSSGYYFTDNLAGNIGIDCSGLGIGDHISWINLSTKAVVFYGLATVNETTIPANKGVKVAGGKSIDFWLKDSSFNARVISGSYAIDWIPGQEPPYTEFIYTTPGSNGIVYYLGATKYSASFINPVTRGEMSVSSSGTYGGWATEGVFTKSNSEGNGTCWYCYSYDSNQWYRFSFLQNQVVALRGIELWSCNTVGTESLGTSARIEASTDGVTWITLLIFTSTKPANERLYMDISNESFYPHYRIYIPSPSRKPVIGDIELYGWLK